MYCKECGHKSVCYTGLLVHYHAEHVMNCQRNVVSMDASSVDPPGSQHNGYEAPIPVNPVPEASRSS
ncbi:unnamed protein product [Caenorhabditis nigoni]